MLAWILRFALALEVLLYGSLVSRFYGKTGMRHDGSPEVDEGEGDEEIEGKAGPSEVSSW